MDFGLIVDLETTGLDPKSDRIIEIGLVEFAVEGDEAPQLTRCYGALQDPGVPLSEDIQRITGLTSKVVSGHVIDWDIVRSFFQRSAIAIAHNMAFDRGFLEASGQLRGLSVHWGCSQRHIDWQKHRFKSTALNYLAADHGFVNPFAHRAVFDCATTFRLVAPYLEELIARSYEREYLIKAVNSPFESKDVLRQRGYRWDPAERCWSRVLSETALAEEREFLAAEVYRGSAGHQEMEVGA